MMNEDPDENIRACLMAKMLTVFDSPIPKSFKLPSQ